MGWGKLDDNLHDHHKVDELNDVAPLGLWTLCLTWAHRHRKSRPDPSFIPWGTVDRLGRKKARAYARELVRVRLWEPADGGVRIHDFADYLPGGSDEERSEKARAAARARWDAPKADANGHAPEHPPSNAESMPDDMQTDASRAAAPRSDSLSTSNEVLPEPTPLRKPRSSKTPARPCPDKIEITEGMRVWAAENAPGVRLVVETAKLVNWAHGKGERKADWTAAWRNWMLRRQEELDEQQRNRPALVSGDEEWMR